MRTRRPREASDVVTALVAIAYIAAAVVLGATGTAICARLLGDLTSPIASNSASAILSAIASGMMALTAILFSLLFVALQVSGSFFTPRLVRILGGTRFLGHALGVFGGTFIYALLALRTIDIGERTGINVTVVVIAFTWLLGSLTVLLFLLPRVRALSIADVLATLYERTNDAALRVYAATDKTASHPDRAAPVILRHEGPPRYILGFDVGLLTRIATDADAVIHLPFAIGDPVMAGQPLALVTSGSRTVDERRVRRALWLGRERLIDNDPAYGIRLLVDVAIRALSPAVNDPTTAVMVLDQLEPLLCTIGARNIESNALCDADGAARLTFERCDWTDLLVLALTEIDQYGHDSLQVQRRLAMLVEDLEPLLSDHRRDELARFLEHEHFQIHANDAWQNVVARDRQGLGHRAPPQVKDHH